jgi:hypothetical protein
MAHEHHHHGPACEHHHEHHHEDDTYYLDQLCLVALSGAFGAVCLSLYFVQRHILERMLAEPFHLYVLLSGIVLMILTVLRAMSLWSSVGQNHEPAHDHNHAHPHNHDHAHDHDHGPACEHHHDHDHSVGHTHEQSHEHQHHHAGHTHGHDHDHGWAPWRYVVLLIPVILFLLGLPNRGPGVGTGKADLSLVQDTKQEAIDSAVVIAAVPVSWTPLALTGAWYEHTSVGPAKPADFKTLLDAASNSYHRDLWLNKAVKVRGQFRPTEIDTMAHLIRFKMQCCAGDAIAVPIPILSKEPISGVKRDDWIDVTAKVEFRQRGMSYVTVLQISGRQALVPSAPDPRPYLPN